jgi:hypothetical protein
VKANGPDPGQFVAVEQLYRALAVEPGFARLQRLMEVDWSAAAAATVEEVGLVPLLQRHAERLRGVVGDDPTGWDALAQTIRYTERWDSTARTALWWLGHLARDPLLRRGPKR